jgi:hypothetical protein
MLPKKIKSLADQFFSAIDKPPDYLVLMIVWGGIQFVGSLGCFFFAGLYSLRFEKMDWWVGWPIMILAALFGIVGGFVFMAVNSLLFRHIITPIYKLILEFLNSKIEADGPADGPSEKRNHSEPQAREMKKRYQEAAYRMQIDEEELECPPASDKTK